MTNKNKESETVTHSHDKTDITFQLLFGAVFTVAGLIVGLIGAFRTAYALPSVYSTPTHFLSVAAIAGLGTAAFLGPGLWAFTSGYAAYRRRHAYDPSHLVVENAPVPVGDQLEARLRVSLPPEKRPQDGVHVELAEWSPGGGGMTQGGKGAKQWSETATFHGQSTDEGMEVPISMTLPDRQFTDLWTVEVTAAFEDHPDYKASFDIPVTGPVDTDLLY